MSKSEGEKHYLKGVIIDGRIILKLILNKGI